MKQTLRFLTICFIMFGFAVTDSAFAQDEPPLVTIRDLNTYEQMPATEEGLPDHPLVGEDVRFVARVVGYPRNSGLASYNEGNDSIGRIHVFVVDTNAVEMGREGMAMQIVSSDVTLLENSTYGNVIEVTGQLTFFNAVAQFSPTAVNDITFDLEADGLLERYDPLLEPMTVTAADLNVQIGDSYATNMENYSDYHAQFVRLENAVFVTISQDPPNGRPQWSLNEGGMLLFNRDISLRYRNDRTTYRTGYNYRRPEDGRFVAPASGTLANVQGFMVLDNFDERVADGRYSFHIVPWDDGVLWIIDDEGNEVRLEPDGWPVDLEDLGFLFSLENFSISNSIPEPGENVEIGLDVVPQGEGIEIASVTVNYSVNGGDVVSEPMDAAGDTYTYSFPGFEDTDVVNFSIDALSNTGITLSFPASGTESFLVLEGGTVSSIRTIQRTADGTRGPSPIQGLGMLPMDIEATVVADVDDKMIIVHDSNEEWSGIFLRGTDASRALSRGDVIQITQGEVAQDFGVNFLTEYEFNVVSSNADYEALIPVVTTQQLSTPTKEWEGMIVRLENVMIINDQADSPSDFGEWEIGSEGDDGFPAPGNGFRINDDLNANLAAGDDRFTLPVDLNRNVKVGNMMDSVTGVVHFSFSNQKLIPRGMFDLIGDDWTFPSREFSLGDPNPGLAVDIPTDPSDPNAVDLVATWDGTFSYDGNDVTYKWLAFAETDDSFSDPVAVFDADEGGEATQVTLPYEALDALLTEAGNPDAIRLRWTVFAYDDTDSVQVSLFSNPQGVAPFFEPVSRLIIIGRDVASNLDDNTDLPRRVELSQNYPNPFNPTTNIQFGLPEQTQVRLEVFNILGQRVATLVNEVRQAGYHTVHFDASRLSSGMYLYRLEAGNTVRTNKMMLVK